MRFGMTQETLSDNLTGLERFSFGDSPALADDLLALVLSGRKTATCWSVRDGQQTEPSRRSIACDGAGQPRAVLETMTLDLRAFEDVDADFARKEGEGDLSLGFWREAHRRYFERNGGFDPKMMLWCEEFRLVATVTA
jgi:uncharacterized protein YhfF